MEDNTDTFGNGGSSSAETPGGCFPFPLFQWAVKDLRRNPFDWLCLGFSTFMITAALGSALLFLAAAERTGAMLFQHAPSIVIRKVGPQSLVPIPRDEGVAIARSVPGIIGARGRTWGVLFDPLGSRTIMGVSEGIGTASTGRNGDRRLLADIADAVVQTGFPVSKTEVVEESEARKRLSLPEGYATDIAVDVFHETEENAVIPDLHRAFPWPILTITRSERKRAFLLDFSAKAGFILLVGVPAMFALALTVMGTVRTTLRDQSTVGLMKAFGWTTREIVKLHAYRLLATVVPGVAVGFASAYFIVFHSGAARPLARLFALSPFLPILDAGFPDIAAVAVEVILFIPAPLMIAVLWSAVRLADTESPDMVRGGSA